MGRAPSCGRRTPSPMSAMRMKAGQRTQRERGVFSIKPSPERAGSGRLAPHLNLDIVVQLVGCVPVAIEPDVAALRAIGVDQLSLVGFYVVQILPRPNTEFALKVTVKDRRNARLE